MPKPPMRIDDLFPDGIRVAIDWDAWDVGKSVFVPCIKVATAAKQAQAIAARKGYAVSTETRVENGYLGLRIWRIA